MWGNPAICDNKTLDRAMIKVSYSPSDEITNYKRRAGFKSLIVCYAGVVLLKLLTLVQERGKPRLDN